MVDKTQFKDLAAFFRQKPVRPYRRNQIILHQDDPLTFMYYLAKGYVKAYSILETGDERTVFILGPGDLFPRPSSIDTFKEGHRLRHYYETLSDVEAGYHNSDEFFEATETNPRLQKLLMEHVIATNRELTEHLEALKTKNAIDKVAHVLPYLVNKCGTARSIETFEIEPKITHQEIADLAGVSRETASVQIKQLEQEGVLSQERNTWTIHMAKLRQRLEA